MLDMYLGVHMVQQKMAFIGSSNLLPLFQGPIPMLTYLFVYYHRHQKWWCQLTFNRIKEGQGWRHLGVISTVLWCWADWGITILAKRQGKAVLHDVLCTIALKRIACKQQQHIIARQGGPIRDGKAHTQDIITQWLETCEDQARTEYEHR